MALGHLLLLWRLLLASAKSISISTAQFLAWRERNKTAAPRMCASLDEEFLSGPPLCRRTDAMKAVGWILSSYSSQTHWPEISEEYVVLPSLTLTRTLFVLPHTKAGDLVG